MRLVWRKFDNVGVQRITQLINKTNQFNLTTRRYTYEELLALMLQDRSLGLQLRLIDRFGDNGIIGIIIGRLDNQSRLQIDTWLMSCRVLGRQVEPATLNLIAAEAKRMGALYLLGQYIKTAKNEMVKDHYTKLGFSLESHDDTHATYALELATFQPLHTCVELKEG
jgi:FkbH-like protein